MTNETSPRLYLVDGTAQLFRAYFAIRGLTNRDGLPTNAVYGFTQMLRKLVDDERPELIGVAFDLEGPTFRHDAFADYKANRPPSPEDLDIQVPYAKRVCEGFRIPVVEMAGFEADDLIATFARRAREAGFPVVVVATDKDLLQLVDEGVTVLNPVKNVRLDPEGVRTSFGVAPDRVRDVLGLMGDSVDNIPGVPGVGEKTAVALVSTYGTMDAVLERARRFVATWHARDRLADVLDAGSAAGAVGEAFVSRCASLIEIEADPACRDRLTEVLDAVGALGGTADPKEGRRLARALRALDKGAARRVWTAIAEHEGRAILSRDLATLDREAPVAFDAEAFRIKPPDAAALSDLFRALGFRSLLAEFEGKVAPSASGATVPAVYRAVLTATGLDALVAACRAAGRFAVDTETDGLDPMRARLVGISLSFREGEGYYIPVGHHYLGVPDQLDLAEVRERLGPLLEDPSIAKVGQNLKYDLHVLTRHGLPVEGWALDTMVAAFLLEPDRPTFSLDSLAAQMLGHTTIKYEDLVGTGSKRTTLDRVPIEKVTDYAAEDAEVTLRLAGVLERRLETEGLARLYREIDGPLLPVLAGMESTGIRVDGSVLHAMSAEMAVALERVRSEIHALAGVAFNVDSPKQLREVLFDRLALTPGRKTAKSGVRSTDAQTLEALASEHAIAAKLLEYRELAKLKGTYVDALPALVHPETGRVHTSFHPAGAATGRLSSSDPNLQNIPARSPEGLRIRSAFVPEPGWLFLASDYSQVELRILAHLCEDPALVAAFRAGEDIHRVTAARVFGVAHDEVDDAMRRRAKAVNFGILYGMSETRLAREQGMTRTDARDFIRAYFDRFPGIQAYIERIRAGAARDGSVRTLMGRVRHFPVLQGRGGRAEVEQALRAAVNTTIQGTAADIMKLAMLRVAAALVDGGFRARMLLQVHDELLLEAPPSEIDRLAPVLRRAMEDVLTLRVPLAVDQKVGQDWREVT